MTTKKKRKLNRETARGANSPHNVAVVIAVLYRIMELSKALQIRNGLLYR